MNELMSWLSYSAFQRAVKNENRFFHGGDTEQFLNIVLSASGNKKLNLPKGSHLWRARLGQGWKLVHKVGEHIADTPVPFKRERMNTFKNKAADGRTNSKGIPYLYLASTKETAMVEVRPWVGSKISVGQFRIDKDIILIDCSDSRGVIWWYTEEPSAKEKEEAVWADTSETFSQLVTDNDKITGYVQAQIIAEIFKKQGFDGIVYKSIFGEGYNVVMFEIDTATLINCFLYEVKRLTFDFQKTRNAYFLK